MNQSAEPTPVCRADQIGSLLRPPTLARARADAAAGRLDRDELRHLENEAILVALDRQRETGVHIYTDGEFRRTGFMTGFPASVDGFTFRQAEQTLPWKGGTGTEGESPNVLIVTERLKTKGRIAEVEAAFLHQHAPGPFKITLPSPLQFALISWRTGLSDAAYPRRADFLWDAAQLLAEEARQLSRDGVPYIQIDAPLYTNFADHSMRTYYEARNVDVAHLLDEAIAADNLLLDALGDGTIRGVHLCRGNNMGRWLAEGSYEPVAEKLFNGLRCERLLLEYDSPRAGSFEPLRYVPPDKVVVLGLVTTKRGQLESRDGLLRRIEEASRYVPVERLALSPQCGFASSAEGNPLTQEDQWHKLELVASVANEVWQNPSGHA